jgi:hypothetical protein
VEQATGIPAELSSILISLIIVVAAARAGAAAVVVEWVRRGRR